MTNPGKNVHQKMVPDPFLNLLNNPKQPLHERSSLKNNMFWKRVIKNALKKLTLFFLFDF